MAALTAYIISLFTRDFNVIFGTLVVFAALVALTQFFFHRYLERDDKVAP